MSWKNLFFFSSFCANSIVYGYLVLYCWSPGYNLISINMYCCWRGEKASDHCAINQKLSATTEEDSGVEQSFIPHHLSINATTRPSILTSNQKQAGAHVKWHEYLITSRQSCRHCFISLTKSNISHRRTKLSTKICRNVKQKHNNVCGWKEFSIKQPHVGTESSINLACKDNIEFQSGKGNKRNF